MSSALQVAIVVVALVLAYWVFGRRPSTGASANAHARVEAGAWLIDVRTPEEYAGGHIEGAKNIPVQVLDQRMGELGTDKARGVVVYCRSGRRSAQAAEALKAAGFVDVVDLGPMSAW